MGIMTVGPRVGNYLLLKTQYVFIHKLCEGHFNSLGPRNKLPLAPMHEGRIINHMKLVQSSYTFFILNVCMYLK